MFSARNDSRHEQQREKRDYRREKREYLIENREGWRDTREERRRNIAEKNENNEYRPEEAARGPRMRPPWGEMGAQRVFTQCCHMFGLISGPRTEGMEQRQ